MNSNNETTSMWIHLVDHNLLETETYLLLLQEESHRRVEKEWGRWKYVCHIFEYETSKKGVFQIGGLTASILIRAASVIYQEPPSFSEYLPDFSLLQFTLNMN